jgi:hypothetical protein
MGDAHSPWHARSHVALVRPALWQRGACAHVETPRRFGSRRCRLTAPLLTHLDERVTRNSGSGFSGPFARTRGRIPGGHHAMRTGEILIARQDFSGASVDPDSDRLVDRGTCRSRPLRPVASESLERRREPFQGRGLERQLETDECHRRGVAGVAGVASLRDAPLARGAASAPRCQRNGVETTVGMNGGDGQQKAPYQTWAEDSHPPQIARTSTVWTSRPARDRR